jgi:putative nucleotidyltransferase with HDIG domain
MQDDDLIYRRELFKGTRSFVSVPLSTPNGMVGALCIGRQSEFSNENIRLLMNISDMAANAIQRASAYEQIQRQLERLKALRTIDMFIASGTDLHLTLQTILNQAAAQLEIDAADILLLNTSMHSLEFSEGIGFRSRGIEQTVLRVGEGYAGRAALERETVVINDISENRGSFLRHDLFLGEGFVSYYGVPLIAKGEVKGVLEIYLRSKRGVDAEWMDFLESLSGQAALAIDNASLFDSLQRSNLELGMAYETTLEGWSAALDLRDKETEGHTLRVTELTLKLAESMGLSEKERVHIRRGALLHDIGKMGIPDRILLKPDSLTSEEWEIMRQHPTYAFNLLSPITHLRPALDIPYCHHERWDGSGYPRGMKGEAIPLAARIFAVVDVYDALCSDRPYRPAWRREKALEYIQSLSGVQFDPKVVEVFLRVVGEG